MFKYWPELVMVQSFDIHFDWFLNRPNFWTATIILMKNYMSIFLVNKSLH